jgi:hypothetical protein
VLARGQVLELTLERGHRHIDLASAPTDAVVEQDHDVAGTAASERPRRERGCFGRAATQLSK